MLVFHRNHVGRAHGSFIFLAAHAGAVAQFNGCSKSPFAGKVVMRWDSQGPVFGAGSQAFRQWRSIGGLAGIHTMVGGEGGLHVAKGLVLLIGKKFFIPGAAWKPSPVLSAHASAELDDEIRNFI